MSIEIKAIDPVRPEFAGCVTGIDIATGVSAHTAALIENAMDKYAVLVFPNQQLNDEQQFQFSSLFGPMEKATGDINPQDQRRLSLDINDISNLDQHGDVLPRDDRMRLFGLGNMLWHSDSSFKETPAKFSLLSARVIPDSGGNTEFADMRAAWTALEPEIQNECKNLICSHSQLFSRGRLGFEDFSKEERAKWAPVKQPLIRQHPQTKKHSLFLSSHIGGIEGWPIPEARVFIQDLTEHATKEAFIYKHQWKTWDLVMWDNRTTMHRARRYDHTQHRDLHRTTVAGQKQYQM